VIEVHNDPDHALSDGPQSLYPEQFAAMVTQLRAILAVVHRTLSTEPPKGPSQPQSQAARS
jgi:3-deoxy-7-phosphoheptulonate synthase